MFWGLLQPLRVLFPLLRYVTIRNRRCLMRANFYSVLLPLVVSEGLICLIAGKASWTRVLAYALTGNRQHRVLFVWAVPGTSRNCVVIDFGERECALYKTLSLHPTATPLLDCYQYSSILKILRHMTHDTLAPFLLLHWTSSAVIRLRHLPTTLQVRLCQYFIYRNKMKLYFVAIGTCVRIIKSSPCACFLTTPSFRCFCPFIIYLTFSLILLQ